MELGEDYEQPSGQQEKYSEHRSEKKSEKRSEKSERRSDKSDRRSDKSERRSEKRSEKYENPVEEESEEEYQEPEPRVKQDASMRSIKEKSSKHLTEKISHHHPQEDSGYELRAVSGHSDGVKDRSKSKSKSSRKDKFSDKDSDRPKKKIVNEPPVYEYDNVYRDVPAMGKSKIKEIHHYHKDPNTSMIPPDEFRLPDPLPPKTCVHHGIRLDLFCESCEEPVCRDCSVVGPHNNQLHRLNSLSDSFRIRVARLSDLLNGNMIEKKEQLLAQVHRIEYRIEEIKYVKTIIERDIRAEYNGMLERLRYAEGVKVAVLQHEIHELQKDLEKINEVGENFMRFTSRTSDPIHFLLKSRSLYDAIEILISKVFKVNIDVYPYDLPRELSEKRLQLEKAKALRSLLDFKDELIFRLMCQKKDIEVSVKEELDAAATEEINEWAKLTDKFANELKKYQLVCYYCSCVMEEASVNGTCAMNEKEPAKDFEGFTETPPPNKFHGTGRHYFSKQSPALANTLQRPFADSGAGSTKSPTQVFLEIQFSRMRKTCMDKGLDIGAILKSHDKRGTGSVTSIQFSYILSEVLGISDDELSKILKFLDPQGKGTISISSYLKLLADPQLLDSMDLSSVEQVM